jgi:hypothetical protein
MRVISDLNITQLLLIVLGLAISAGGVIMLFRGANADASGTPRPLIPLGIIAVGIVIAYHIYSDFRTMDTLEVAGTFLFGLAFAGALATKFFVADRLKLDDVQSHPEQPEPNSTTSGNNDAGGSDS